jgi:plastocyanin
MKAPLAVAILVTAALTAPAAAHADSAVVSISRQAFDPSRVTVVAGDTLTWRNSDFTEHDVGAGDGSFDSGRLQRLGAFTHRFDRVEIVPYLCTIHPFMRGQVDVAGALLHGPHGSVPAGQPLRLEGRAAAGATSVALERAVAGGGWQPVAATVPGPTRAFTFVIAPAASSAYRAVTVAGPSPPITVQLSTRSELRTTVRLRGRRRLVAVASRPAAPHALTTLQRYSRWHYSWRARARGRLDGLGRTTFELPAGARGLVRVVLSPSPYAPALAISTPVRLRNGRPAADPLDAIGHEDGAPHAT